MTDVVTLGEPIVALVADDEGGWERAAFHAHVTGAELNVATGLARLGHAVAFVGVIGADPPGRLVERALRAEGIGLDHVRRIEGLGTALLVRDRPGYGPPEVVYRRAGSAGATLSPDDLAPAAGVIARARWLHVTGVTCALSDSCRAAVTSAVATAAAAAVPVSLDINHRATLWDAATAHAVLAPLAARAAIVFGDDDELRLVARVDDPVRAARALLAAGAGQVVRKRGARGAEVHDPAGGPASARAPAVTVLDAIGAGDAFAAGYLSATLDGGDADAALERGTFCAAHVLASVGDTTGLPGRQRLTAGGEVQR